jgi:hydrogenase nickel incorporation protein HypB
LVKVRLASRLLEANEKVAERNRKFFRERGVYVVNLMSSPGSGKTSILERTISGLAGNIPLAVIEGDIYTSQDAERIEQKGTPVVQINTSGACHLDAHMVEEALSDLDLKGVELLVIENVGNLVCPAEFDLGEDAKVTVLSTAEGNDKPMKYPLVFRQSRAVLVNKIDLLPYTDFDVDALRRDVRLINPELEIFAVSAKTGEGLAPWCEWLAEQVKKQEPAV